MVWQRPFFSGVLFLLALLFTILYESFFSICYNNFDFMICFIRGIAGYRIALYGLLNFMVYYDFVHYFVKISRLYLVLSLLRWRAYLFLFSDTVTTIDILDLSS